MREEQSRTESNRVKELKKSQTESNRVEEESNRVEEESNRVKQESISKLTFGEGRSGQCGQKSPHKDPQR